MIAKISVLFVLIALMEEHFVRSSESALASALLQQTDDSLAAINGDLFLEMLQENFEGYLVLRVMHFDTRLVFQAYLLLPDGRH